MIQELKTCYCIETYFLILISSVLRVHNYFLFSRVCFFSLSYSFREIQRGWPNDSVIFLPSFWNMRWTLMWLKSLAGLETTYLKTAGIWVFKVGREAELMIDTIMKVMSCAAVYLISALQWQWKELPSHNCLTWLQRSSIIPIFNLVWKWWNNYG